MYEFLGTLLATTSSRLDCIRPQPNTISYSSLRVFVRQSHLDIAILSYTASVVFNKRWPSRRQDRGHLSTH